MFKILVLAMLVSTAAGFPMQVYASSGLGVFLDNKSSDNKHLSFTDTNDNEDLTLARDNTTTVGGENTGSNTLGNTSEDSQTNSNSTNMTQDTSSS